MNQNVEELRDILSAHAAKYPLMQPQDAVKLVYQNEFGGGHLVKDEADSLQRLRDEWQQVHSAHNGFQCTGNGFQCTGNGFQCTGNVSPCAESVFQCAGNVVPWKNTGNGRAGNIVPWENIGNGRTGNGVPWENIGNGFARIYLSGLDTSVYSLEQFNHDFVRSGQMHSGTMHNFLQKLEILRRLAEQNMFSFAPEELQQFLETYLAAGCPMVSHSAEYRAAYVPAYRVIQCRTCAPLLINRILALESRCENVLESVCENFPEAYNGTSDKTSDGTFDEISNAMSNGTFDEISNAMSNGTFDEISNAMSNGTFDEIFNVMSNGTSDEISNAMSNGTFDKTSVVIAIDGRCAAGKSTFAAQLAQRYHWNLIHMDDFFPRPEQRTSARLSQPGGNVDYERVRAEVLEPLRMGKTVCYQPFDCHSMLLQSPVTLPQRRVTLIEGSYACHPELWNFYDLRVFLTVAPDVQAERILQRNGSAYAQIFRERWIPMEEHYFSAYGIEQRCDAVLERVF